ncbi:hypothetical protein XHV734_3352 [Xanthomonas hortorum pv. vitians]|nr:hypothetical protein XHV734_3352 [Xanthomonas hortorum pv. vitians]
MTFEVERLGNTIRRAGKRLLNCVWALRFKTWDRGGRRNQEVGAIYSRTPNASSVGVVMVPVALSP